jgi:uncharacterized Rmd1/YagE family protein
VAGAVEAVRVDVRAFAIASTIPVADFVGKLAPAAKTIRSSKTHATLEYGPRQLVVVHDFGAIVFFGIDEAERQRTLRALVELEPKESRPPLVEDFIVVIDPTQSTSVGFDRMLLPQLSVPSVELVALVVGQSAAMEYYENDVDRILARIDAIATELAATGRFTGKLRPLTRFIGEGMVLRNRVIHTLALLDAPLLTWEDETLDRVHRELQIAFAINDRYRALDQKLSMIRDNLALIVDLVRHKRSLWLEICVVALILLEVVLFIVK